MNTIQRTPMMQQWAKCKELAKTAILFFRLGDFFEAFEEDAVLVSDLLDLTLTKRHETPMCGIPWHSVEGYIDRLVAKGYSVALADQISSAEESKGLVERKIVRTFTPGTAITSSLIAETENHYIALVHFDAGIWALSLLDLTTGDFYACENNSHTALLQELYRARPKEILVPKNLFVTLASFFEALKTNFSFSLNTIDNWRCNEKIAVAFLKNHFHLQSLSSFGIEDKYLAVAAAGGLLSHVSEELLIPIHHIQSLKQLTAHDALFLDRSTIANLELFESKSYSKQARALFDVINNCMTPMGARKLRSWLEKPSITLSIIRERQDSIDELIKSIKQNPNWKAAVESNLKQIRDLERLILRISTTPSNPKELLALANSCSHADKLKSYLEALSSSLLRNAYAGMRPLDTVSDTIYKALSDLPPLRIADGGVFRAGYNRELDELTSLKNDSETWLLNYQTKLRDELGIKTLKVGFNKAFGYFIEVSRGQAEKMPPQFARRQTLVNGERYITQELKEYEEKVLSAESRIRAIEEALFTELKSHILTSIEAIRSTASGIALFDALFDLAKLALDKNYSRPEVYEGSSISIKAGRHPVAETYSTQSFVPNDLEIDSKGSSLLIITGPNMGGKSTYIRQQALLVIMAQMGSFIPAQNARIGLVDKVFSRIGASDDLGSGQSTFMVEMAETASILNQATAQSLIILDEIGRGTSTYDGIAIAGSVAEHLIQKCPKTLFATHYYELTDLEIHFQRAKNYSVAVYESKDEIKFLYKIVPGKADKSYGIHVAQLAGLPPSVLKRARELLDELEAQPVKSLKEKTKPVPLDPRAFACLQFVNDCNLNELTPLQCFTQLINLKNSFDKR